jgi:hypothetical protein
MRILYIPIMSAILLFGNSGVAGEKIDAGGGGRIKPYLFCNVFLADGCFGIAAGDRLTMQVITDFVQYDIMFSSGGSARLYSGFNPNVMQEDGKFENCAWSQRFSECKTRVMNDRRTEFIARRSAKSTSIHLVFDATVSPIIINSFVRNIRSCTSNVKIIRCDSE